MCGRLRSGVLRTSYHDAFGQGLCFQLPLTELSVVNKLSIMALAFIQHCGVRHVRGPRLLKPKNTREKRRPAPVQRRLGISIGDLGVAVFRNIRRVTVKMSMIRLHIPETKAPQPEDFEEFSVSFIRK